MKRESLKMRKKTNKEIPFIEDYLDTNEKRCSKVCIQRNECSVENDMRNLHESV